MLIFHPQHLSVKLLLVLIEKQIKDVQESRDKFARETRVDATDAAGVRRKLPIHYHCISCNRPVELPVRDSEPALPENDSLPYRRMKFPFVSYDVEQVSSLYDRHTDRLTFFTPFSPNSHLWIINCWIPLFWFAEEYI